MSNFVCNGGGFNSKKLRIAASEDIQLYNASFGSKEETFLIANHDINITNSSFTYKDLYLAGEHINISPNAYFSDLKHIHILEGSELNWPGHNINEFDIITQAELDYLYSNY